MNYSVRRVRAPREIVARPWSLEGNGNTILVNHNDRLWQAICKQSVPSLRADYYITSIILYSFKRTIHISHNKCRRRRYILIVTVRSMKYPRESARLCRIARSLYWVPWEIRAKNWRNHHICTYMLSCSDHQIYLEDLITYLVI